MKDEVRLNDCVLRPFDLEHVPWEQSLSRLLRHLWHPTGCNLLRYERFKGHWNMVAVQRIKIRTRIRAANAVESGVRKHPPAPRRRPIYPVV